MRGLWLLVVALASTLLAAPARAQETLFDRWVEANQAGRHADAERFIRAAIEQDKVNDPKRVPSDIRALATTLKLRDKYQEASAVIAEGLEWCRKYRGEDEIYGSLLSDRGTVGLLQAHYDEAERDYLAAIKHLARLVPASDYQLLTPTIFLASTYEKQGRHAEAEQLVSANLRYLNSPETGTLNIIALQILSNIAESQGRFDRAEILRRESFVRALTLHGPSGVAADASINLANIYRKQGRYQEALPLYQQSLAYFQREYNHRPSSHVAGARMNMATALLGLERYDEALAQLQPALEAYEQIFSRNSPQAATCLLNLGATFQGLKRLPEAEAAYREALSIQERNAGPSSPAVARVIMRLTQVLRDTGRHEEGLALLERAAKIRGEFSLDPELASRSTMISAQILWAQGKQDEALAQMEKAMSLAEQQRGMSAGAGVERAAMFGGSWEIFEQMVAWQSQRGNVDASLKAIERWRARSFLEEMTVSGADLLAGYSQEERKLLLQRESQLREVVSRREPLVEALGKQAKKNPADADRAAQAEQDLDSARQALYDFTRDTRNASPVYRNLISREHEYAGVARLRELLGDDQALALAYLIGARESFVIAVTATDATITPLTIDAESAKALGAPAGKLTREALGNAFINREHAGLVDQLSRNQDERSLAPRLHVMWKTLMPAPQRELLTSGKATRLVVLPDGPLSLLPFEALVVAGGEDPQYLLDVGPPIVYGPSATVLANLAERPAQPVNTAQPVLTIGDPDYGPPEQLSAAQRMMPLRSSRTRLNLSRLPFSGTESQWVGEVFGKAQVPALRYTGRDATEANLRKSIPGREIVHLACHGMSDLANGNFFGALAVATGNSQDPANDGMLQLAEIYGLDLRSCELAILSACMTNHGPQQHGEGTWALSRGFLVAGARRVVASNWVVDDQAGATLISYYANFLARAGQDRSARDYAKSLHEAKKLIRKQEKWSHPFYWSGLVHVGPK